MRNTYRLSLLFPPALAFVGCGGGGSYPNNPLVASAPLGRLGGSNIALQVTATGGTVTLPCGQSGQITQPITLDATGHFDVTGTLTEESGTPFPNLPPVPVRFTGTTDGKTMTLTITTTPPPPGAPPTSPYTLTYGAPMVLDIGGCPG